MIGSIEKIFQYFGTLSDLNKLYSLFFDLKMNRTNLDQKWLVKVQKLRREFNQATQEMALSIIDNTINNRPSIFENGRNSLVSLYLERSQRILNQLLNIKREL